MRFFHQHFLTNSKKNEKAEKIALDSGAYFDVSGR